MSEPELHFDQMLLVCLLVIVLAVLIECHSLTEVRGTLCKLVVGLQADWLPGQPVNLTSALLPSSCA